MTDTSLYGFDGSTCARAVRCVLARKGIACDQVPVLGIDGMRLRETDAIMRYLDARTPEPAMFPADARARAKAGEARKASIGFARTLAKLVIENKGDAAFIGGGGNPAMAITCWGRLWPVR